MYTLTGQDLGPLAEGLTILSAGGGFRVYDSIVMVRRLMDQGRSVRLIDADMLGDDARVAVVANWGAPIIDDEWPPEPTLIVAAIRAVERQTGQPFDAVMPIEIAGGNGMQAVLASALMGIPLVDADAMGRAFPEVQMNSFALAGLSTTPVALVDPRGNETVITAAADWTWLERMVRATCGQFGGRLASCMAPRTGAEVRAHALTGTVSLALALGRGERARAGQGVRQIFTGCVRMVERVATSAYPQGCAILTGLDDRGDQRLELRFKNEYAAAIQDGRALVTTPDILFTIDADTGDVVGADDLRDGLIVEVCALDCDRSLLGGDALAVVGPPAYDLEFPYVAQPPIDQLEDGGR